MTRSGNGLSRPATWVDAFKQGGVFLAFAIPFVWLIGMIGGAWSIKGEWGNAADWVQAIGSLLALFAAGYFPYRHGLEVEQRAERRLVEEQRQKQKSYLERVEEICRLAKTSMNTGKQFLGEYPGRIDGGLISDAIEDAYRCLNAIDVFTIENFRVAQDVLLIRSSLAVGRGLLKGIMSSMSIEREISYATFCKCASNVEVGWQRISNITNPPPSSGSVDAA